MNLVIDHGVAEVQGRREQGGQVAILAFGTFMISRPTLQSRDWRGGAAAIIFQEDASSAKHEGRGSKHGKRDVRAQRGGNHGTTGVSNKSVFRWVHGIQGIVQRVPGV